MISNRYSTPPKRAAIHFQGHDNLWHLYVNRVSIFFFSKNSSLFFLANHRVNITPGKENWSNAIIANGGVLILRRELLQPSLANSQNIFVGNACALNLDFRLISVICSTNTVSNFESVSSSCVAIKAACLNGSEFQFRLWTNKRE